jgi:uncharacterized protein (TIGR02118 family)
MIKIIATLKRKPGMTLDEFVAYYAEKHMPLAREVIPSEISDVVVYYVQNHARNMGGGKSDPPYDCVTEIGFEDEQGLALYNDWYLGPTAEILREDEGHFIDKSRSVVVVTDERRVAFIADGWTQRPGV